MPLVKVFVFMCIVSFHRPHGIRKYTIHLPVGMRGVYAHFMCMVIILWSHGIRINNIHASVGMPAVYAHFI